MFVHILTLYLFIFLAQAVAACAAGFSACEKLPIMLPSLVVSHVRFYGYSSCYNFLMTIFTRTRDGYSFKRVYFFV